MHSMEIKNHNSRIKVYIKLILVNLLLVTFIVVLHPINTYATSAPTASAKVNSSSGAYLRKSSSTTSASVALLDDNTSLVIHKEVFKSKTSTAAKNRWYYVTAGSYKGYIRADLVDSIKYSSVKSKVTGSVAYRKGAGTKMKKAGTLKKGKTVNVYLESRPVSSTRGSSAKWYKIRIGSKYYHVCSSKIKLTGSTGSGQTGTGTSGTESESGSGNTGASSGSGTSDQSGTGGGTSTGGTNNSFARMTDAEFDAYLTSQGFPASYRTKLKALHRTHPNWVFTAKKTGLAWSTVLSKETKDGVSLIHKSLPVSYRAIDSRSFKGSAVQVYKTPSASAKLTTVKTGDTVTLLAEVWKGTTRWNYVRTSAGKTGYIKGAPHSQTHDNEIGGVINASSVNIRNGAGTDNSSVKTLAKNTAVQIVLQAKDKNGAVWYKIRNAAGYAYVKADFVTFDDAEQNPASLTGTQVFAGSGSYITKDGSSWYNASSQVVGYYLDPRNFLTEDRIYMFENLSYNSKYQTTEVVNKILSPTRLPGNGFKAALFMNAGKSYKISPVHLASRARQETGGGSIAITGYKINGKKVYNPFNIGAGSGSNPALTGLKYAYKQGWTTQTRAVNGAASFLASGYIARGQNTIYYQRFNVANGNSNVAVHQYMTNIQAPYSESYTTSLSYKSYKITDEPLVYEIPVYSSMPAATTLP